ncbi:MAG: two-component system response regulator [Elusimicrobia bacterium RIFOXYA2_FULL_40_6]|nr:MAG: two-component system response regulator [Elusimicrobia bacterium RIFOXYA2_FULL_40_6]
MIKNGSKLIVIVDDEDDILELVSTHVEKAGYKAKGFSETKSFLKFIEKQIPDLVILDIMLPGMDGYEICKTMKSQDKYSSIPIIMLTAKSEEFDKVLGLELGADDYVTKPFSPRELMARIKAVLRRNETRSKTKTREIGNILVIDLDKYEVLVEGKKIDLTTTEFKILEILSSKKGFVYSREKLLDALWGQEKAVLDRTIDVHINNLREKLGKAGKLVKNIRGIGYKLEEN